MKVSLLFGFVWVSLGCLLVSLAGCAGTSESARFYKLSSIVSPGEAAKGGRGVAVGIGPIKFPDHLARPEIVTRTGRNALQIADFDRWAGSLQEDFSRVLTENLSILLSTDYVFVFPWQKVTPIDYRVRVEVSRFDGELGKSATLIARWTVTEEGKKRKLRAVRRSNITEPVEDDSYESLVAAMSRTVEALSREIARTIRTLSQQRR
ncbi:MAG: membrane integrity-associated transporter subunit PqiC [Deltaproteobacteria bacterium]|nr:membrane integrity-associated transporter subunit PqiC [Deltaproteobacteria bacterium]